MTGGQLSRTRGDTSPRTVGDRHPLPYRGVLSRCPLDESRELHRRSLPAISEAELTAQVMQLLRLYRWRTAHFRPAQTAHGWRTPVQGDGKGYPDITALRGSRIVVAELKAERGAVAPEQQLR